MTQFAEIVLAAKSDQIRRAKGDLDGLSTSGGKAEKSAIGLTRAMAGLAVAVGAVGGALRIADQYSSLNNGLMALGNTSEQAARQLQSISDIAMRTRAPLDATAQLYTRISIAAGELGASQQDVLRFTENVGLALGAAGIGANQASGALIQLSQAMAGGVVRAEEFNSILENAFPLAQAAANGIDAAGGSVGRLRQLVVDGKVSSDVFFNAILAQSEQLQATFDRTTITIGQAMTNLGTAFTTTIGQLNQSIGATSIIAEAVNVVAENMDTLVGITIAAGGAFLTYLTPAIYGAVTALVTLKGALIATGIGAAVVAAGLLIGKFIELSRTAGGFGEALTLLTDVGKEAWARMGAQLAAFDLRFRVMVNGLKEITTVWLNGLGYSFAQRMDSIAGTMNEIFGTDFGSSRSADMVQDLAGEIGGLREQSAGYISEIQRMESITSAPWGSIDALRSVMSETGEATSTTADAASQLAAALAAVDTSGGTAGAAMTELDQSVIAADKAVNTMAHSVRNELTDAWEDFVDSGLKDFESFGRSILKIFGRMLAQMILLGKNNPIQIGASLGMGGMMQAVGGATGGLAGMANTALAGVGGLSGLGSAFMGGASLLGTGITSGFAAGGIGGAISGGASAFATAMSGATTGLGGAAAALGAAIPVIGAVALVFSAFKTKTKLLDTGVKVAVDGLDVMAESFSKVEKSRFFGLSKSRSTSTTANPELAAAVGDIQMSVMEAARVLGTGATAFDGFSYDFQLSLKGLDEEQRMQAINQELMMLGDNFAQLIPGMESANEVLAKAAEISGKIRALIGFPGFETLQDQIFATAVSGSLQVAAGSNTYEDLPTREDERESQGLLRGIIDAVREGNINNARLTAQLVALQQRQELAPA